MRELWSDDGEIRLVVQDDLTARGVQQVVVYNKAELVLWDRGSSEAGLTVINGPPAPNVAPVPALRPSGETRVIQVTDASDGTFVNRGQSYWSQLCLIGGEIIVFIGHVDGHPRFFRVDTVTGLIDRLGPLLDRFGYFGTAEGLYFDADGGIYFCDGPRLRRVDPSSGEDRVIFDISSLYPGCRLFQAHSSDDGSTHSATVQQPVPDGPYPNIATVVSYQGQIEPFSAHGTLDESAITTDGAFLVIKETPDGNKPGANDTRIITLGTRETRLVRDADGALGHSDCGPDFIVGEADKPDPGRCVLVDLRQPLTLGRQRTLFTTLNMGHVSMRAGRCLVSAPTHISLVMLDGSGVVPLLEHGMVGDYRDVDFQVQANLDHTANWFFYLTNKDGRLDGFIGEVP